MKLERSVQYCLFWQTQRCVFIFDFYFGTQGKSWPGLAVLPCACAQPVPVRKMCCCLGRGQRFCLGSSSPAPQLLFWCVSRKLVWAFFFFCSWSNNTDIYPTFKSNWEQIPNGLNLGLPLFGAFDVAECVSLGTGALSTAFGCQGDVYCWRSLSAGSVISGHCYCPVQVVSFVRGWKGIVSPCQFASRSLGD